MHTPGTKQLTDSSSQTDRQTDRQTDTHTHTHTHTAALYLQLRHGDDEGQGDSDVRVVGVVQRH